MKKSLLLLSLVLLFAACTPPKVNKTNHATPKIIQLESSYTVPVTTKKIMDYLKEKGPFTVKLIDHTKSANKVGLSLSPTQLIIFGNPKMGTLLMQENAQIGQELPLKTLVYTKNGQTYVEFKDMSYLKSTYHIQDKNGVIKKMNGLLNSFAKVIK